MSNFFQRAAGVTVQDEKKRTVEIVWTTGAAVERHDFNTGERYQEVLSLKPAHVRMARLNTGAPLLAAHRSDSLEHVIGVVERAWLEADKGRAIVRFAENDPEVDKIWNKVRQKIIRNISAGYLTHRVEKTAGVGKALPVWRVVDWEPVELSAVPVGADAGAGIGRAALRKPMDSAATAQRSGAVDDFSDLEASILRIQLLGLEI